MGDKKTGFFSRLEGIKGNAEDILSKADDTSPYGDRIGDRANEIIMDLAGKVDTR